MAGAERCKEHQQALATDFLLCSLDALAPAALSAARQLVHHQPFVNLVVTNVPGPDVPLYVLGARMLEAIPLVPLAGNLSVGVAALSYGGQLTSASSPTRSPAPTSTSLALGIDRCFRELIAASAPAASPRGRPGLGDGGARTSPRPGRAARAR